MKIGIIGNTPRAEEIGRVLTGSGHELVTGIPYDKVTASEAIVIAVPWEKVDQAVVRMGPVGDKVVIDAVDAPEDDGKSGAERLAQKLNSAHVVEAFAEDAKPGDPIPVCADDPQAKAVVMELIRSCGYEPEDAGPLANAAKYEHSAA